MHRFGPFEVNFSAGEIRKNGIRIGVQEQPLRILEALLERPGELVSREQLRTRLWPSDTFVDFEGSLNAAVAKLRQSLGDAAERPVYIETVPRKGYRFIAAAIPIQEPPSEAPLQNTTEVVPPRIPKSRMWIAAMAGALVIGGAGTYFWRSGRLGPTGVTGSVSFTVLMPPGNQLIGPGYFPNFAVSPDGRSLAFVAAGADGPAIYLRPMSSESSRRLEGTEPARLPFWSPDGREIGFISADKLKAITVRSGVVRVLCDAPWFFGATWSRDGTILFSSDFELYRVPAGGGQRKKVAGLVAPRGELRHGWPQFLPDGKRYLFLLGKYNDPQNNGVYLGTLDGAPPQLLFLNRTKALFSPPDLLVYVKNSALVAQPWDLEGRRSLGEPHTITNDVNTYTVGSASFSLSGNGVLGYLTTSIGDSQFAVYRRDGTRVRSVGTPGPYTHLAVSPDEKMAAFSVRMKKEKSPFHKIWLLQMENGVISPFEFEDLSYNHPVWSPDSKRLVFSSHIVGFMKGRLWQLKVGETTPTFVYEDGKPIIPQDWSSDGQTLLCRRVEDPAFSLSTATYSGANDIKDTPFRKDQMRLSPDGRWIAYFSDRMDRPEVFIAAFPGFTDTKQVSPNGGVQPVWSRSGKELYYLGPGRTMMSVSIESGATLNPATPKVLFKTAFSLAANANSRYAVSADGNTFYILEPLPAPVEDEIHIVTNWNAELGH